MEEMTLWILVMAVAAIFAATIHIVTDAMRAGLLIGTKQDALKKKHLFCLREAESARQRIRELTASVERRRREIHDLKIEVERAQLELNEAESKARSRNPTRHKVPSLG